MKRLALLLVAVALAMLGVALTMYAEADDSPGGALVGWLLLLAALVVGVKGLLPMPPDPPQS
jgi:hypothetical protein